MRYLLIALMVLAASPAQSDVICGKDWITFTATYSIIKSEKDDSGDPFLRYKGQFTFRKSKVFYIESVNIDSGQVSLLDWNGSYYVEGDDYHETIRCLG